MPLTKEYDMKPVVLVGGTRERKALLRFCRNCDKWFMAAESAIKRGEGQFCGNKCSSNYHKKIAFVLCEYCGEAIPVQSLGNAYRYRWCKTECRVLARQAQVRRGMKRGAKYYGARAVYKAIGGEMVCSEYRCKETDGLYILHINNDLEDNRPENLMPACSAHQRIVKKRLAKNLTTLKAA